MAMTKEEAVKVATELGFPANKLIFKSGAGERTSTPGGTVKGIMAASFDSPGNTITIYNEMPEVEAFVIAHEVFHWKQQLLLDSVVSDRDKQSLGSFATLLGHTDYMALVRENAMALPLAVTQYTRKLWYDAVEAQIMPTVAVWETLASMAELDYQGKLPCQQFPATCKVYRSVLERFKANAKAS